jgi:antitoxin VapB
MSSDGRVILLSDQSANPYAAYVQHADGSSPVRVGQGDAYSLSPDGRWVVAVGSDAPPRILLHPTGPGESREVPNGRHILVDALGWMPDGKRLVAFGSTPTERSRGFVLDAKDGAARPFTDEGVSVPWSAPVVSPDGSRVVGQDAEGHSRLYSVDGGPSEPVPGLAGGDRVLQGRGRLPGRGTRRGDVRSHPAGAGCGRAQAGRSICTAYAWGGSMLQERHVRLFRNGRNQALRIPRDLELPGHSATLRKEGSRLIVEPVAGPSLLAVLAKLKPLDEDFLPIVRTAAEPVGL